MLQIKSAIHRLPLAGLALAFFALAACGAPLLYPNSDSFNANRSSGGERRVIPAETLARKAVCYSGYRAASRATLPTESQVKEDLKLLVSKGFGFIRIYDPDAHGALVLKVISTYKIDLKVMLGIWISGSIAKFDNTNQSGILAAIELANKYPDIVAAISVGNETMVDWSFQPCPPADIKSYINQVKAAVGQPVGTDDNFEPFTFVNELGAPYGEADQLLQVAQAADFLNIHSYALMDPYYSEPYNIATWDWRQEAIPNGPARAKAMMDAALDYTKKNLRDVRTALSAAGCDVPLMIGETGWTNTGKYVANCAHPVNQKMFYDRVQSWVYGSAKDADSPQGCFFFEAFDEPWKGDDNNWGLFDVNRIAKYVLSGTGYTENDAAYYVTPTVYPAVSTTNYWLYGKNVPGSDVTLRSISSGWVWNGWDSFTTASGAEQALGNQAGDGVAFVITPTPKSWGWGMALAATLSSTNKNPENLSLFANGHLNFKVKTSYPGTIEVGFRDVIDVYIKVNPASNSYGYAADGTWHQVSIPIASLTGSVSGSNLKLVNDPFVIANRYAISANDQGTGAQPTITVEAINWTRN